MDRIVTLTTDFGLRDHYQGAMKGVLLSVNPQARIVDISHLVAPGNILEGAFVLLSAFSCFPEGTVHAAVVDPGVGGRRKPILIETNRYLFVGPDNGLLSLAARADGVRRSFELSVKAFFRPDVSSTFHGRDIFAPVAGHLSKGADPAAMGRPMAGMAELELPVPAASGAGLIGEVIYIDSFGNAITSIRQAQMPAGPGAAGVEVLAKGAPVPLCRTYALAGKGSPLALIGSSGLLEIAVNLGSASEALGLKVGDEVVVREAGRG